MTSERDGSPDELTHVDAAGAARMVDVAGKEVTVRQATATGVVHTTTAVIALLVAGDLPKGDALATARIAGIAAAKRTPDLIPLCHPIALHGVKVDLAAAGAEIRMTATVRTADRTGVEMEALTSVTVAGLALIDMIKAVDPAATIDQIRVEEKLGGKTGYWSRDAELAARTEPRPDTPATPKTAPEPVTARVIVASNRAAAGVYADTSGPLLVDGLRQWGCELGDPVVVPDGEPVEIALRAAIDDGVQLVVTSGGTGCTPTDRTPEMTSRVLDREIPGIAEALRHRSASAVPTAILSRGLAGIAGRTLVVNLPGSTGGARDGLAVLGPIVAHARDQIRGGDH